MNYYEFLNKKISTMGISGGYTIASSENFIVKPYITSLFSDDTSAVRLNGESIFTTATREDLSKIDYNKVLKNNDNPADNVELSPLEYVLKEFFSLDKIKAAADSNGDGEVSVEEAQEYVKELALKDGDGETLSLEDFEKLIKEQGIDLEAISKVLENVETPAVQTDITQETIQTQVQSTPVNRSFKTGNSAPVRNTTTATPAPKTIHNMTLTELKAEKTKREAVLSEKREVLNAVQAGKTAGIQAANEQMQNDKKAYEQALKEDSGAKKFAKKIIKNNANIEKNQIALDKNASDISAKESEISEQQSSISSAETMLSSLEGALAKLPAPSGEPENKDKDEQLKTKRNQLSKEIAEKKKEIAKQKSQLDKYNKSLEKLQKEKTKLEKEKTELIAEKTKLDELVNKNCSETTKSKLAQYNKSVQNVETVKAKELSAAQSAFQNAQNQILEINGIITQKEADKAASKYSESSEAADKAVELAESQIGVQENGSSNDSAEIRKYKNGSADSNPWCASFVSWLYGAGQNSNNSETFGYTASSQAIKSRANAAGYYASKNSNYNPKKGDLAMWTKSAATGHVGIVTKVYDDGSFDVVEGNSGNAVKKHHYSSKHSIGEGFDGFVQMDKWLQA